MIYKVAIHSTLNLKLQNSREKWPLSFNTNTDVWNLIKGSFQVVQIDSDIVQEEYVGSETSQTLAFLPFYYKKNGRG